MKSKILLKDQKNQKQFLKNQKNQKRNQKFDCLIIQSFLTSILVVFALFNELRH